MVITWRTKKITTGFDFTVYTVGYQVPSVTLKTGTRPTRARAASAAKAWVRYLKAEQRRTGTLAVA